MALTAARKRIPNRGPLRDTWAYKLKGSVTFYNNALVALIGGYLRPCTGDGDEVVVGVVDLGLDESVTTAGSDGATTPVDKLPVKRGCFPFKIAAGGDAVVQADVGKVVYAVDDETIAKTDDAGSGGKRPIAGTLKAVEGSQAWVDIADELAAYAYLTS